MSVLPFVARNWRIGLLLLLLAVIAKQDWQLRTVRHHLDLERQAHTETIGKLAVAAEVAKRIDAENALRVARAQTTINQEVSNGYQARLDDLRARAAAQRMRSTPAIGGSGGAGPAMPGLAAAPGSAAEAPGDNRLSPSCPASGLAGEEALIASEQALQLDALITWTLRQAQVPVNEEPGRD